MGNVGTNSIGGANRNKSILDHKSIQDHPNIGNDRAQFMDWSHKLKNKIRGIYGKDKAWEHWIEQAEYSMTDTTKIRTKGNAVNPTYAARYEEIGDMLIELLTEKLESGSTPYLKVKRSKDGLAAWGRIYRYYREISGQGLLNKEITIMQPTKARRDEEVVAIVEKWEDDYKECLKLGMEDIKDSMMITVLRIIATESLRNKLDDKIYTSYEEAREELMRHANRKYAETRDQDVDMGGAAAITTSGHTDGKGRPSY